MKSFLKKVMRSFCPLTFLRKITKAKFDWPNHSNYSSKKPIHKILITKLLTMAPLKSQHKKLVNIRKISQWYFSLRPLLEEWITLYVIKILFSCPNKVFTQTSTENIIHFKKYSCVKKTPKSQTMTYLHSIQMISVLQISLPFLQLPKPNNTVEQKFSFQKKTYN